MLRVVMLVGICVSLLGCAGTAPPSLTLADVQALIALQKAATEDVNLCLAGVMAYPAVGHLRIAVTAGKAPPDFCERF